jgi:tetratricopeptide repeat protein
MWGFIASGVFVIFIGLLRGVRQQEQEPALPPTAATRSDSFPGLSRNESATPAYRQPGPAPTLSAQEIVTAKVSQFGRKRRELVQAIAARSGKEVPAEVERFFDAVESGRWDDIKAHWDVLAKHSGQYESSTNHWEQLDPFWPAVLDAYGVAEQAHLWPPQKLLDYGNAILDSLRPGMVYVGGTDNGRWIPELLNETSDSEPRIIVTQNALADARYLDFVNSLYSDRMTMLTPEDSQRAFQEYVADAQQRLAHDQQFPDEPPQIRPGEDTQMVDGKIQVGGSVAVMAINERILQTLMQKNPDLSFAIQESFPFKGTYADALPLGPIMELAAANGQNSFTPEQAAQSLEYWQSAAQQVLTDPESANSPDLLKSYSHDADSAANLLAAHNFTSEAEQGYRLAMQLWPGSPESVGGLADVLVATGRESEARQLLQDFARQYPDLQNDLQRTSANWRLLVPAQPAAH